MPSRGYHLTLLDLDGPRRHCGRFIFGSAPRLYSHFPGPPPKRGLVKFLGSPSRYAAAPPVTRFILSFPPQDRQEGIVRSNAPSVQYGAPGTTRHANAIPIHGVTARNRRRKAGAARTTDDAIALRLQDAAGDGQVDTRGQQARAISVQGHASGQPRLLCSWRHPIVPR
jgi:hypothetical protein